MLLRYRIVACRSDRTEDVHRWAARTEAFFDAVSALDPRLAHWRFRAREDRPAREARGRCVDAYRAHRVAWTAGRSAQVSYQPCFEAGDPRGAGAELEARACIALPRDVRAFAPERVIVDLRAPAADALVAPDTVAGVLAALVSCFAPDFAHAGTDSVPVASMAFFGEATPPVGWFTWLAGEYGALAEPLPAPLVARPVARGTLLSATGAQFRPEDPAHREALALARHALTRAGMLARRPGNDRRPA